MRGSDRSATVTVASVPLDEERCIRVSLETDRGRQVADLRVFERFTAAKVFMPTSHAVKVEVTALSALAEALQTAARAGSAVVA